MQSYERSNDALPPAAVIDKNGKPLLSWRVLILPYIEQESLYKEFHLNEPWDSPHNIKLLERMPRLYEARSRHVHPPPNTTFFKVFVGKGTPFEPGKRISLDHCTKETVLIAEAGDPVPWTKPAELDFDPDGPLPNLAGIFPDVMRATLTDGRRRDFQAPLNEAEIREMIRIR